MNCSYDRIECAGLPNRLMYDFGNQPEQSGTGLKARKLVAEPREVERLVCVPNKGTLGRAFRNNAQKIISNIEEMDDASDNSLQKLMESDGKKSIAELEVSKEQVTFKIKERQIKSCSQS